MEHVKVGLWSLPGLKFEKNLIPQPLSDEMETWCAENHCGMKMTENLWSFKNDGQRDWFILRWSELIPKPEKEDGPI
jgi:hypothetical protein